MMTREDEGAGPDVVGRWSMRKGGQQAPPYGAVTIGGSGTYLSCRWTRAVENSAQLESCGITDGDAFIASRSWDASPSGIVIYDRHSADRATAVWTFSGGKFPGKRGAGALTLEKPRAPRGWSGTWHVHYTHPAGDKDYRIEIDEIGGLFELEWYPIAQQNGSAGQPEFKGIGIRSGERLIAAWGMPASDVQLLMFKEASGRRALSGECVSRTQSERGPEQMVKLAES